FTHRGAGAYICGEETGLLESLEGKRAYPRNRPPFPAIQGAFGCPTVVNNIETLSNVPHIINRGADWYKSIGPEKSPGPKLFCLSGHINKPGLYELPMGFPLKDLIYDVGGGILNDRKLKGGIHGGRGGEGEHGFRFGARGRLPDGHGGRDGDERGHLHGWRTEHYRALLP